jgi:hypothetical protein
MHGTPVGRVQAGAAGSRPRKGVVMKRTIRYLLSVFAVLATVSCATYGGKAMRSIGEVAVISIQCNRIVDASADSAWKGSARAWPKSEKFDLGPAAARLRSDIFGAYAASLPFTLVDEQSLLSSEAYLGLGDGTIVMRSAKDTTLPTGYLPVSSKGRTSLKELIARFPDVNGFLWAEVSYTFVKKRTFTGFDFAAMRADLTVTVLDRNGRGILRHTEIAEDPTEFRIAAIQMVRAEDVAASANRATARASAAMAGWLEAKGSR